jgi:hypothetical protein
LKIAFSKHVARLLAAFAVLALCTPIFAQSAPDNPPMAKGKKAYSLPISDREIQFQVTVPSSELFTIRVKEGEMAKVIDFKDGYAYAMIPVVKDVNNKTADFGIYRLAQDKDGNESISELEHITVNFDEPAQTKSEPKLQIKLTKIDQSSSSHVSP